MILESELKALRSQINPHYLSNSLMSLQGMILENEKEKAFEFIGQYGKVMRDILEKSDYSFILLEQEIQTIKDYIKLEGLIRNINIELKCNFNSDNLKINSKNIKVPSMIFQPFVENAILHGLLKKVGPPYQITLLINIENQILIVKIIDNGVGFFPKKSSRKSYGLDNIENRLNAYSKILKINSSYHIETIYDKNQMIKGSQVIIYLPYILEP